MLHWIRNLMFCSVLFFVAGCAGGGTSGTGIKTLEGQVLSESGKPLAGVEVSIPETGQTTQTAEDGTYTIFTNTSSEQLQVDIDVNGVTSSLVVDDVPQGGAIVNLDMAISEETGQVSDSSVEITPITISEGEVSEEGSQIPSSGGSSSTSSDEILGGSSDGSSSTSSDDSLASSSDEVGSSSSSGATSSSTSSQSEEDPVDPPDDPSEEDPDGGSNGGGEESG